MLKDNSLLLENINEKKIHLVGIKGTGLSALAEVLAAQGAFLTGSDVNEYFYSDEVLAALGIDVLEFDTRNIKNDIDLVIHSAAYDPENHPELLEAKARRIPVLNYPQALGLLSTQYDSTGISGVHGKTTTTAMIGAILGQLDTPATILAGSAVSSFNNRSTLIAGDQYFIAETCEYRKHFLNFHPKRIVLTSVESDHNDYFPSYESIRNAFVEYINLLPCSGCLIFCADDAGASEVVEIIQKLRPDILLIPYGFKATGQFRIKKYWIENFKSCFTLNGFNQIFRICIPGKHIVSDAAAALTLAYMIEKDHKGPEFVFDENKASCALENFKGSRRRCEIVLELNGITILDDYAHHPTAIKQTLSGLRDVHKNRRIIVDFMSHTYSRTKALFNDFSSCFKDADEIILHKIYASARETYDQEISGKKLFDAVIRNNPNTVYFEEPEGALEHVMKILKPGDIFITMGAGDNFKLGKAVAEEVAAKFGGKIV